MRTSLSSAELALLRTRPSNSRFHLAVHRPPVVLLAGLGSVPTDYPGSVIQLTGIASGVIGDVKAGMAVRIGTSPNQQDLGTLRVRKTSTGTTLQTQEYGSGLVNFQTGACVTILEDYPALSIHKNYSSATSQWTLDLDTYTSQLSRYGPLALLGPPHVGFTEGGKMAASYVGDRSYSLTPGASITSQTWLFPDGQTVTSKLGSSLNPVVMTFTNASSGGRYHTLTVTDGNSNSHIGQRLTFAFNTSAGEPHRVYFDNITGGLRQGGYRTRVYVYGSGASNNFPDGAQVVIFENASYGTAGSSVGGNYFGRNNIVMVGWIAQESTRIEPFTGETSFEVETIDGVLQKAAGYDIFLESSSAASAWDMASGLTLDRAAVALLKYHSTIANVVDFNLASGTGMTNEIPYRSLPIGSLWSQLTTNYDGMLGIVASDMQSSIYAQEDAQINGGSANLPVAMAITKGDRRDTVSVEHEHRNTRSLQRLYAVMGGTTSPIGAQSPATWQGAFGTIDDRTGNLTAPDQDTLITWAGNKYAADNNPYKRVVIPLAGNMRIDPVPQCRVTMSLSGSESVRDIAWSNKVLLPNELSINYDARSGFVNTELVAETSVNGIGGSSLTYPRQTVTSGPVALLPDISLPVPPPATIVGGGNDVFMISSSKIIATNTFLDVNPVWRDITGTVTGTMLVFRLDPFDPANKALVLTTAGVWYTTNITNASPTWTQILTLAQLQSGTYASAQFSSTVPNPVNGNMQMTMAANGYVSFLSHPNSSTTNVQWWYCHTNNYIDGIWTFNQIYSGTVGSGATIGHGNYPTGFALSQNTTSKAFVCPGHTVGAGWPGSTGGSPIVFYTTDEGVTWSYALIVADTNATATLFIPPANNPSDLIIFAGTGGGGGSKRPQMFKTTTGPSGFTNIFHIVDGYYYGPIYEDAFTESPASPGGTTLYASCIRSTGGIDGGSALIKYDGTSWTTIQSNTTANNRSWAGPGFGGWPYNNIRLQMHNGGFGSGSIGRTEDGGLTWINATGNLATIATGTMKYIVPIWTV